MAREFRRAESKGQGGGDAVPMVEYGNVVEGDNPRLTNIVLWLG